MTSEQSLQVRDAAIGKKSQQALQLQLEESKEARRQMSKNRKEAQRQCKFGLRRQKRSQKHKGH